MAEMGSEATELQCAEKLGPSGFCLVQALVANSPSFVHLNISFAK
jgi:hypothetical protein